jgi:hypothetical protein
MSRTSRDQVFISYSHKDEKWLRKLRTHLKPFKRTHRIEVWDDTHVSSGDRWRREIEGALGAAKVAILLKSRGVSDIFVACVDWLKGFPEAIEAVYPRRRCMMKTLMLVAL